MKIFITDFSGAMKAIKLKLGTHMDSGMLCIPESRPRAYNLELYRSIGFTIFYFVTFLSRTVR